MRPKNNGQLPLSVTKVEYFVGGRVETLTQLWPDGRVFGWRETYIRGMGVISNVITQTAYEDFMECVQNEKSEWNKKVLLRYLYPPDSSDVGMLSVIPDHLWGKPRPFAKAQVQPPVQVLRTNKDICPAMRDLSRLQLMRKFKQTDNRCNNSICSVCECFVDHSDSLTVCDFTGRIEMYPHVQWGPVSSPQYPLKRPHEWSRKSDEYIHLEYDKLKREQAG